MVLRQRNQRLEARVTPDQKEMIERAATVLGRSVTDFVVTSLQEAAQDALAKHSVWKLNQEQQQVFFDTLMNPPAPNPKLRSAFKRYEKYKASAGR
jgi:uncharacterized protein (DUF1778 family)